MELETGFHTPLVTEKGEKNDDCPGALVQCGTALMLVVLVVASVLGALAGGGHLSTG